VRHQAATNHNGGSGRQGEPAVTHGTQKHSCCACLRFLFDIDRCSGKLNVE
jgi:hypothetical protein